MSETKELVKRDVVKVGVIMSYGLDNAAIIEEALRSENTSAKLTSIVDIIATCTMEPEKQLWVIQKLLSYPKAIRFSIANQIKKRLEEEAVIILRGDLDEIPVEIEEN